MEELLKSRIRSIKDFPKPGIIFRDITPLLKDPIAFGSAVDAIAKYFSQKQVDYVAGIEARGFIVGAAVASKLNVGFVPIRKKGKLPYKTVSKDYQLEYNTETIEIHVDAVEPGKKVAVIDDLLATGGTSEAACELIEKLGGEVVGLGFIVELKDLKGREHLKGREVFSLIQY
ncbi:MAG: adenine phosphoribosyltransferase [Candidatus Micrarchaeia archaeon]